jgi:hypothetical protein
MKPKKWTDVYPHGTKEGDEELKFFISLARNQKYQWRSISAISKETGLTKERVEEIIAKYYKKGMVFQNPKNEDQWGYWERVPEMLPKAQKTISQKDQDDRINKVCKDMVGYDGADGLENKTDFTAATVLRFDDKQICHFRIKSNKAENFIVKMKDCLKKNKEEFWVPFKKTELHDSEDVAYFRKKLFEGLCVPKNLYRNWRAENLYGDSRNALYSGHCPCGRG